MPELTFQQNDPFIMKLFPSDCFVCGREIDIEGWCESCESDAFEENFKNWTSGNLNIDDFIKNTQLNATERGSYLEYIDFDQFESVEYIKNTSYSTIYSAMWMEGPRQTWDEDAEQWIRDGPTRVALKRLDTSLNISEEYLNKMYKHRTCFRKGKLAYYYGITKVSENFMVVMKYYDEQDLYSYLSKTFGILRFETIVDMLWDITGGLEILHDNELIHGNIHSGNILINKVGSNNIGLVDTSIADVGMHDSIEKNPIEKFRALRFVAPEILYGFPPTKASDIYSVGVIMRTLGAAYHHSATEKIPDIYIELMNQCLDPDPSKRPTIFELFGELENSLFFKD